MIQDKITEGNKLIAEFMGVTNEVPNYYYLPQYGHYVNSYGYFDYEEVFRSDELKYHSSWDWLMPVVKKIVPPNGWGLEGIPLQSIVMVKMQYANINEVYEAVIEFIKYYNENRKT